VAIAAAVIGRAFELELLARILDVAVTDLAEPLAELQQRFVIVPTPDGHGYRFRHALICDAVYEDTSLALRRTLHGRVADALVSNGAFAEDSVLSAHYEHAGRRVEAYQRAMLAAARASSLSAHREAMSLYQRALANLDPGCPPLERAWVHVGVAGEAAATDDNASAAASYEEAITLFRAAGLSLAAGELVPRLVAARHLLGDDLGARVSRLERALEEVDRTLEPVEGEPRKERVRAELLAGLAAAYMLDRRLPQSIQYGEAAMELAGRSSAKETTVNIASTLASVLVFAGRMEEGWRLHAETIERAREQRLEAEAARAYRMAGTSASVLVEYPRAEAWLREGVEFAERVELWNHRHYIAAHLAHVCWATGDLKSAEDIAAHVMADGRGGITTRITALHVLGYVALVKGAWQRAEVLLGEARILGDEMGELQRYSPALWGLAEVALLRGEAARAVELSDRGFDASHGVEDAAYLFPFLVTGTRARLAAADPLDAERWVSAVAADLEARRIPGTLPAIAHARGLLALSAGATGEARGALEEAQAAWESRRRVWEGTWATIDLARCAARTNRPADMARYLEHAREVAATLGSPPLAEAAASIPLDARRGPRDAELWSPLTAREFQVARLVADGWTNPDIAAELGISPRTAASHVEHILSKLGTTRRAAIGAWVATVQLPSRTTPQGDS
jgi:ATP/maltotriose-dependent transcriptional regulator MalT